jgi:hypothetical protein
MFIKGKFRDSKHGNSYLELSGVQIGRGNTQGKEIQSGLGEGCTSSYWLVYLQYVNIVIGKLYFNEIAQ